jgi:hypothetical protein
MRHGLEDQLLKAMERGRRRTGVDRPDAAGMPRAPGLEEVESLGAPHLADRNAVGTKPKARSHQVRHGDARRRAQSNDIGGVAAKLARVLDEDDPVLAFGRDREQGVGERRLAARGAARDEDVGARPTASASQVATAPVMVPAAT